MLAPRRPGGRLGAGPQSSAKEACRDDAGVVQNHQFATPQQRRELNELTHDAAKGGETRSDLATDAERCDLPATDSRTRRDALQRSLARFAGSRESGLDDSLGAN